MTPPSPLPSSHCFVCQIGEYLGEPGDNIQVMHAYTDQLDFSGCATYLAALRLFLSVKPMTSSTSLYLLL